MRYVASLSALVVAVSLALVAPAALAAADSYTVDTVHSSSVFRIKHADTSYFWGRFNDPTGTFALDEAPDETFACVIEAAGVQETLDLAGRLTAVRGRLVIAGYHQDGSRTVDMQLWNWRGLDVVNAHERDPEVYLEGMRAAVDAVRDGRLDRAPLVTHTFPLDRAGEALEAARTRPDGFLKAVVTP